jgi:hypothetical protein
MFRQMYVTSHSPGTPLLWERREKERKRLIHEIKEDVLAPTKEELEHLRNFILVPAGQTFNLLSLNIMYTPYHY